jgi:hypothetical protein
MRTVVDLTSTSLRSCSYDSDAERLEITFENGRRYSYEGVPPEIFEGLRDAGSPGQFYNQNIKDKF